MTLNPLPFLSSIQTYLIVGAVSAVLAGAGGAYAGYRWEAGKLADLKLADAQAQVVAVQQQADSDSRQAALNLTAALAEARMQDHIASVNLTLKMEIPQYVTPDQDRRVCLTVGLLRVLRAAEDGVTPGALQLAPGQSDDDCADYAASALAGNLSARLGADGANAEQLNALEAWIIDNHNAQVGQ